MRSTIAGVVAVAYVVGMCHQAQAFYSTSGGKQPGAGTPEVGSTQPEVAKERSTTRKKDTKPGGQLFDCLENDYVPESAGFPSAFFKNICEKDTVYLEFSLRKAEGCSGTATLAPGGTHVLGAPCDKQKVKNGGGFVVAVCPAGYLPKGAEGVPWKGTHRFKPFNCEKAGSEK